MRSITEIDTEPRLKTLNGNCEAASGPTHFNFFSTGNLRTQFHSHLILYHQDLL